jgi:hypothetical protein
LNSKHLFYNLLLTQKEATNFEYENEALYEVNGLQQTKLLQTLFRSTTTLNTANFTLNKLHVSFEPAPLATLWEVNVLQKSIADDTSTNLKKPSLAFLSSQVKVLPLLNNTPHFLTSSNTQLPAGGIYYSAPTSPVFNTSLLRAITNATFSEALKKQNTAAKTERFLYNYTILHRHSIKYGANLTNIKRLFSAGFYDSQLIAKNV